MVRLKKEKIGKYNKVYEPTGLGKLETDLVNKLSSYATLINKDRLKIVTELIEEKLEGKILDNNFIVPDNPFYFNFEELLEKNTVMATTEKPSSDLYKQLIIKRIPNNLDTFKEGIDSYCYDNNPKLHRGIIDFSYKKIVKHEKEVGYDSEKEKVKTITINKAIVESVFLIFNYDVLNEEEPILKISLIDYNELPVLFDDYKTSDLYNELKRFYKDSVHDKVMLLTNCFLWKYNNNDVINAFHLEKDKDNIFNVLKVAFSSSSDNIEVVLKLLDELAYKTVDLFMNDNILTKSLDDEENIGRYTLEDSFKEALVELDFYNKLNNLPSDNPEKCYDIFRYSDYYEETNEYEAIYDRLFTFIDRLLDFNKKNETKTFIDAFPFEAELFQQFHQL